MEEKLELVLFVKQLEDGKACFHCWDVSDSNPVDKSYSPIIKFNADDYVVNRMVTLFIDWYESKIVKYDIPLIKQLANMFSYAVTEWAQNNGDASVSMFSEMIKDLYMSITDGDKKATEKNYKSFLADFRKRIGCENL